MWRGLKSNADVILTRKIKYIKKNTIIEMWQMKLVLSGHRMSWSGKLHREIHCFRRRKGLI